MRVEVFDPAVTHTSLVHELADDDVEGLIELLRATSRRYVEGSGTATGVSISHGRQAELALAGEKWALVVHDWREWITVGSGPEGQIYALWRRTVPLSTTNFVDHAEVEPVLVHWLAKGELSERMQWAERRRPVEPSLAIDVLRPLVGRTLTRIFVYRRAADYPGRLSGSSCAIEVDTGEIVRFGLLKSLASLSVFLERDARGQWYDEPPELDVDIRVVRATDATEGDPALAAFEGLRIEGIQILSLDGRGEDPLGIVEERGALLDFGPAGAFVIGVGLDRPDGVPDHPVILVPDDIPESVRGRLLRDAPIRSRGRTR